MTTGTGGPAAAVAEIAGRSRNVPRPVVVASKCLELEACRYNGVAIRMPFILGLISHVELRPVCPEVEIGLGTPRDPIRLVRLGGADGERRLVQPSTGRDLTAAMAGWSEEFLAALPEVDGFVLKSRSPSCGIKDAKVWGEKQESGPLGKEAGMFAEAVLARFPHAAVEDEGRLTNFRLRHHFLTKIYARARFRQVRDGGRMADLVEFQSDHKLLLLAYHQGELRTLGRLVANPGRRPFPEVAADYEHHLSRALARPPRDRSHENVLLHALGYFSQQLTAREKAHFLDVLEQLREGRVTLSVPLALLQSWIHRFEQPYLARQVYFQPYPLELLELSDSGRGR